MHDVRVSILFIKKLNKNGKRDKIHAEGGMCTIQQKIIDQITILIKFRNFLCLIRPIFLFLCNIVAE